MILSIWVLIGFFDFIRIYYAWKRNKKIHPVTLDFLENEATFLCLMQCIMGPINILIEIYNNIIDRNNLN
jgi:hypothetical protein